MRRSPDSRLLVDAQGAYQSRAIFWDPDVYQEELKQISNRCWLFLCHESQIPEPGDFLRTYMGEDDVIVARGPDGVVRAFLNARMHRGNKVCQAEWGNTRAFTCSYHGWSYATDGSLAAVPLEKEIYGELDRKPLALHAVPHVDSYRGMVFGNLDPAAPTLREYLGDIVRHMDTVLDATPGGIELIGTTLKTRIPGNWKLPVENAIGDGYHLTWAHAGAVSVFGELAKGMEQIAGLGKANSGVDQAAGVQVAVDGHTAFSALDGASGYALYDDPVPPMEWITQQRTHMSAHLGPLRGERFYGSEMHVGIFPNVQIISGLNFIRIIHPCGPGEFEVWSWVMVQRDMPAEVKANIRRHVQKTFGSAGLLEGDDGDFVEAIIHSADGYATRHLRGYLGMDVDPPEYDDRLPGELSTAVISEHCQRAFYRQWRHALQAPNARAVVPGGAWSPTDSKEESEP